MRVFVDLHAMDIRNGLVSNTGSEGRWAQSWAKLLAERGHQVICICGNEPSWGITKPVPNVEFTKIIPEGKFDLALYPGEKDVKHQFANLYIHMFFSPCFIIEKPYLYNQENQVITIPYLQYAHNFTEESAYDKKFNEKTFLLPTPTTQKMYPPHFESNIITWSVRWGPQTSDDIYFLAMIKIAKKHKLHTKIFMKDNFFHYVYHNEGDKGIERLKNHLNEFPSLEFLPSLTLDQVYDVLKVTKVCVPYQPGGSSLPEQIVCGALPLPAKGTESSLKNIDTKLYDNPYPGTVDKIVNLWERALLDKEFYEKAVRMYQEEMEHTLYDNCIKSLQVILSKYGYPDIKI